MAKRVICPRHEHGECDLKQGVCWHDRSHLHVWLCDQKGDSCPNCEDESKERME
jgi:hypothetical protein